LHDGKHPHALPVIVTGSIGRHTNTRGRAAVNSTSDAQAMLRVNATNSTEKLFAT
jgi:hypothetical protein